MGMGFQHWFGRFQNRIITILIGIVILIAVAVGIPAIKLIRTQLDHQAWVQVYQGIQATGALYEAYQNDLERLALLTAQRPTLTELILDEHPVNLENYLITLQNSTLLDLIAVCDTRQVSGIATEEIPLVSICQSFSEGGFNVSSQASVDELWLTSAHPISGLEYMVVVGLKIDDQFSSEVKEKIGLEHIIWKGEQRFGSSIESSNNGLERENLKEISQPVPDIDQGHSFQLLNTPYISSDYLLDPDLSIHAEILLSTSDILQTQIDLIRILIGSIAGVALVASVVGIITARQISQPLEALAETAAELSSKNLAEEVSVATPVREISQVADALENARRDLWETLSQLQLEKRWVDHLLSSIVEGIITLDDGNRITYFSRGAEKITGWESQKVLDRTCDDIFQLSEGNGSFSQAIPKPGKRHKMNVLLANGKQATLAVTRAELAPTGVREARAVLVFRDISEEEAVHRILGNFISNIAHEFKTPLSALAASTELLLHQSPELTHEELQELIISLNLGIVGLQTLIDNLLELSLIHI